MTPAELEAIRKRWYRWTDLPDVKVAREDVAALVQEVRRLDAALTGAARVIERKHARSEGREEA